MPVFRKMPALLASLLLACLAAACGGSVDESRSDAAAGPSELRILTGTTLVGGRLRMERARIGERELLQIHADDISGLRSLYLALPTDGSPSLLSVDSSPLDVLSPISLAVPQERELHFGWVLLNDGEPFSGSGLLASFELDHAVPATTRRTSKAVPAVDDLTRNARWNILTWSYLNPGDYDQNGVVSISDLTPLGQNFQLTGPFGPGTDLWMVDGDGNGEINLADISVIGQNFGNTVTGYELYAAVDGAGYPDPAGARLIGSETVANAARRVGERLGFGLTDNAALYNDRYFVVEQGSGTVGNLTPDWNGSWHAVKIHEQAAAFNQIIGDMTIAGGRPMLFFDTQSVSSDVVLFARALDPLGDEWAEPVVLSGPETNCLSPKAQRIDGRPAMAFGVLSSGETWFRIAADEHGESWNELRMVSDFGLFPVLLNDVAGRAVVCDNVGGLNPWLSTTDHEQFSMLTHLTDEAEGYDSLQNLDGFQFIHTPDATGQVFISRVEYDSPGLQQSSPVLVSGNMDHTGLELLRGRDGRLHVLMRENSTDNVLLASSTDNGDTWTLPTQVATLNHSTMSATFAYGRIWAGHYDGTEQRIMRSEAELKQPWQDIGGISSGGQPGGTMLMGTVRSHPAVVYPVDNAGTHELWYSIWY